VKGKTRKNYQKEKVFGRRKLFHFLHLPRRKYDNKSQKTRRYVEVEEAQSSSEEKKGAKSIAKVPASR
jgi:hypothetical protein